MKKNAETSIYRRKFLIASGTATLVPIAGCTSNGENGGGSNNENEDPLEGDDSFTGTPFNIHPLEFQVEPTDFDDELGYDQEPIEITPSDSQFSVSGDFIASDLVLATPGATIGIISTLYTCDTEETATELRENIDSHNEEIPNMSLSEEVDTGTNGVIYASDDTGGGDGIAEGVLQVENIVCQQAYIEAGAPTRTLARRLEEQLEDTVERIEMQT